MRRISGVHDHQNVHMGLTFKENCPDLRNTRVIDIMSEMNRYNAEIDVFDPWVNPEEAHNEYSINVVSSPQPGTYDAVIVSVGHSEFKLMGIKEVRKLCKDNHVVFDVKYIFDKSEVDGRL
ncbi:MAG: hypothetical protein GY820_15115 [Gammaproteobacteria bacterium]|nr:hypothetical protein [Gammaproteobacteria bacterium]